MKRTNYENNKLIVKADSDKERFISILLLDKGLITETKIERLKPMTSIPDEQLTHMTTPGDNSRPNQIIDAQRITTNNFSRNV